MKSTIIKKLLTNLITKKFYPTQEEAMQKIDIYFAVNRLSEEDYTELTLLVTDTYAEPTMDTLEEPIKDVQA